MKPYNPSDYETVKSRKLRFYQDHPDGRIIVELQNKDDIDEKALFKATIYLNKEDQEKNLPRGIGYALELRDTELSKSSSGKSYESVNFSSWTENAEESAVGRGLDNSGYASNARASRDEMEKAERMSNLAFNKAGEITVKELGKPFTVNVDILKANPITSTTLLYKIPFGKFKGKVINEIPQNDLVSYANYLQNMARNDKKPLSKNVQEFINEVEKLTSGGDIPF